MIALLCVHNSVYLCLAHATPTKIHPESTPLPKLGVSLYLRGHPRRNGCTGGLALEVPCCQPNARRPCPCSDLPCLAFPLPRSTPSTPPLSSTKASRREISSAGSRGMYLSWARSFQTRGDVVGPMKFSARLTAKRVSIRKSQSGHNDEKRANEGPTR